MEKIEKYARKGKCAHFVMIDEDGRHVRRIATKKWKAVPIKRGRRKKLPLSTCKAKCYVLV